MPHHTNSLSFDQQTAYFKLQKLAERMAQTHMRDLFQQDAHRFDRYQVTAAGIHLDFSKNRIDQETFQQLLILAKECHLKQKIEAMFSGKPINNTEQRPALHIALRNLSNTSIYIDSNDIMPEVRAALAQMEQFVWQIHSTQWRGFTSRPFSDVVSIGIGGSFLGPKLASAALKPYWKNQLDCHYVANIDGSHITEVLRHLNPQTTLFLVQSKSFSTQETLENALVARRWFLQNGGDETSISKHFVAVTANNQAATNFGIKKENIFPMWDWVGGRYSLWSTIGLPIALAIGFEGFKELLAGAHAMDQHFLNTPISENLPVILGLLGIWYNNFMGADSQTIIPYDHYLRGLPAHLQQLDMESNGKCVDKNGYSLSFNTGPIIWGGAGANGQHAYHQLLHQGTRFSPVDFIIPLHSHNPVAHHHHILYANCLSQSQALMQGKTREEARVELLESGMSESDANALAPHKVIPGNKPSNTISFSKARPYNIGALIAMYEHKVYVQGALWNINCFDQWGVELGKQLGANILQELQSTNPISSKSDSSTAGLIRRFRQRELL